MSDDEAAPVAVSRRIAAPAGEIFSILADPGRHRELDGSGMVRAVVSGDLIRGVGDVFVMAMRHPALGDYEMDNHVVVYEPDRSIGWAPRPGRGHPAGAGDAPAPPQHPDADYPLLPIGHRWIFELTPDGPDATLVTEIYDCSRAPEQTRVSVRNGAAWLSSMRRTLERLERLCTAGGRHDGVRP
jgi:hypothetical protein